MKSKEQLIKVFAARLSATMELRDIKAADLSRTTKISKGTISLYLQGKHEPQQHNIQKIADALSVSPAWLAGLTDDMLDISAERQKYIDAIEALTPEGRKRVLEYAKDMSAKYFAQSPEGE